MLYELTLTLRPRLYDKTATEQYIITSRILRSLLEAYPSSCVAELTGENNIHYHCKIDLKDHKERDSLLNRLRLHNKMFGRKTCTQLMHEPNFDLYMRKDIKKTTDIIGRDPWVIDFFEVSGDLNPRYIDSYCRAERKS